MEKHYLVTGGQGFIGNAIVKALLKKKNRVTIFDNLWRNRADDVNSWPATCQFVKGDVRDKEHLTKASRNVDAIIHLASINGTKYFYEKPSLVLDVGS